jgi:hypothetical protein
MKDSFTRGEAPFASHLMYDQPGILDDTKPEERELGIEAGLAWSRTAIMRVFYLDFGMSDGMNRGRKAAKALKQIVVYRTLGAPWSDAKPSSVEVDQNG